MKRFSALIFDVDGTLAETEDLHRQAFNEAFAYFELEWVWDAALYRQLLRVTGGKERIRHFSNRCQGAGRRLSDEEVVGLHRFKTARYAQLVASGDCVLRPGVADLIRAALDRGQRLAIATTTTRGNSEALLAPIFGNAWTDIFSVIVSGDDVDRKKPAPDTYLKALDALRLPARACLAIEDSRNGLVAARDAGIPVLITRSVYFHDDEFDGALTVIDDLTKLEESELPW